MMISQLFFISLLYFPGSNAHPDARDIVKVQVNVSSVYAGESNMIVVMVEVQEGYHIQANKVNDESLVPTTLALNKDEFATIGKLEFPANKEFLLEGTDTVLWVYDGKFQIKLFVEVKAIAQTGKYVLGATLRYQACDSKSCLFPRNVDFSIPIEVKNRK